jgi:heptosyltransferase II
MARQIKKLYNIFFICLATILSPFMFVAIYRRKKRLAKDISRILVIPQLARLGDIVCSTPVLRAIKSIYPQSHVSVLISAKAVGIIKNNPRIDEIINFEDYTFWGLVKKIRQGEFNWSVCLSGVSNFSVLVFMGLVVDRVKITRANRPITEILTDWMCNYKGFYDVKTFLPGYYVKMLEPLGIKNQPVIKEVFTSADGDKKTEDFLKSNSINRDDLLIGISVTAGNKIKEWGDDKFSNLASMIADKYGAKTIFIGAKVDGERIRQIVSKSKRKDFFPATDFSMEELPSLMKRINLFIAVDTGPIYVAHALKVPLIDITGPVDPCQQPPEDDISVLVKPPAYIKPSSFVFKKPGKPSEHKLATDSTKVEDVFKAVEDIMVKIRPLSSVRK